MRTLTKTRKAFPITRDQSDDLSDVVSDNVDDITNLQEQVNNLPPPTDISELSDDVDEIAKQVGQTPYHCKNTRHRSPCLR